MSYFRNLILFLNRNCQVGCSTCNVNAKPNSREFISQKKCDEIFNQNQNLIPDFIIVTGGEPFNSFDQLTYIADQSQRLKKKLEILTSGIWYQSNPGYLNKLKESGPCSLRISLDSEHQQGIPFEQVIELTGAALDLGIEVNFTLRQISDQTPGPEYYQAQLLNRFPNLISDLSRRFHIIPHFELLPPPENQPAEFTGSRWKGECPQILKELVIGWDGQIYPCCGIFQKTDDKRLGLKIREGLTRKDIQQVFYKNPELKILHQEGPNGWLKKKSLLPEDLYWGKITYPCDLCLALWYAERDPNRIQNEVKK